MDAQAMNRPATTRLQQAILRLPVPDWKAAAAALRQGANLDAPCSGDPDWTLLTHACRWDNVDIVRWLVENGANPNVGGHRYKPLTLAAAHGYTEIIRLLLEGRANIEARDQSGWTSLAHAVWQDRGSSIALLLAHGANPNARGPRGETVLMRAVNGALVHAISSVATIGLLLDHGLDPSIADNAGRTTLEFFVSARREDLVAKLDAALATPSRAAIRCHLLDHLSAEQRTVWLPKSCAVETATRAVKDWGRKP